MRKTLVAAATVGTALLSGCSDSSSSGKPSFTPAHLVGPTSGKVGGKMLFAPLTGEGPKTEGGKASIPAGNRTEVWISCIAPNGSENQTDPQKGGVEVVVGSQHFGSVGCTTPALDSAAETSISVPVEKAITGEVSVNTTAGTKWRIWITQN